MRAVIFIAVTIASLIGCVKLSQWRSSTPVTTSNMPAIPLDTTLASELIDIRAVGDTGMAYNQHPPMKITDPIPSHFESYIDPSGRRQTIRASIGEVIDDLDKTGVVYRGDLSFVNWETVTGTRCDALRGPGYYFTSHPDNLIQLYKRGFNIIGLANNHMADCGQGDLGLSGPLMTEHFISSLSNGSYRPGFVAENWLWHGVTKDVNNIGAKVKTFVTTKGHKFTVAFASIFAQDSNCDQNTICGRDRGYVLRSFTKPPAKYASIKILATHCLESTCNTSDYTSIGENFIQNFGGDIVFGHGLHRWQPVYLRKSSSGKIGVIFRGLGNFNHPFLALSNRNIIARVLMDPKTFEIRQLQVVPIWTHGAVSRFRGAASVYTFDDEGRAGGSNITWTKINDALWSRGWKSGQRFVEHQDVPPEGAYANVSPL